MVTFKKETRLAIKNLQRKVSRLEDFTDHQDKRITNLEAQLSNALKEKTAAEETAKYKPDALFREFLTGEEVVDAETHRN